MKILAIETSCDETAIAIIEASGTLPKEVVFNVLSNLVLSQVKLHAKYGGVFPSLAKREHAKNLIPLFKKALEQSFGIPTLQFQTFRKISGSKIKKVNKILEREPELLKQFLEFIPTIAKQKIDAVAVTYGPGLEPALWVGINFAKALHEIWGIPLIPINHMEGHLFSALLKKDQKLNATCYTLRPVKFPALALLISGGHTELVRMKKQFGYEIVGETKDDAVGEAFDKVARMLGLSYPGGPALAALAAKSETGASSKETDAKKIKLPRPMINSGDFNFSFSGLKTAVFYTLKKIPKLTLKTKKEIAREFEEAATEVLAIKFATAAEYYKAKTMLVGGGVSANNRLSEKLLHPMPYPLHPIPTYIAPKELTGDNALMIAVAAYARATAYGLRSNAHIRASGSLRLSPKT